MGSQHRPFTANIEAQQILPTASSASDIKNSVLFNFSRLRSQVPIGDILVANILQLIDSHCF